MPSGRDSFRRNRVAPSVRIYFSMFEYAGRVSSFGELHTPFPARQLSSTQTGYLFCEAPHAVGDRQADHDHVYQQP